MDNLIVITLPDSFPGEAALVELMLRKGIDRVHIRKYKRAEAEWLIEEIPAELRQQLRVHYYSDLAERFGCELHEKSRSCHSLEELREDVDYQFLSPIYDSISKEGYRSRFDLRTLHVPANTIALGGVTPTHFDELDRAGFGGAAMLGYLWADKNPETIKQRIDAAIYYSHKL